MANVDYVGNGKVYLLAGGGKTFSDKAAMFCRKGIDTSVDDIIASPQSKAIIRSLIESRHFAALEFDKFLFAIEGYSRVTEVQMVRKRLASYMISSGRVDKHGERPFDVVLPNNISAVRAVNRLDPTRLVFELSYPDNQSLQFETKELLDPIYRVYGSPERLSINYIYRASDILSLIETWYNTGVEMGVPEEDLRYMKPQATAFRAAVLIDAANLRNWAMIRMCNRAQTEIRDLVTKMVNAATEVAPELMAGVGPTCKVLGYCPESEQCKQCKGKVPTKKQVFEFIEQHKKEVLEG